MRTKHNFAEQLDATIAEAQHNYAKHSNEAAKWAKILSSTKAVRKEFKIVPVTTASSTIKEANTNQAKLVRYKRWTENDHEVLAKRYKDGTPLKDIAAELGRTYAATQRQTVLQGLTQAH